MVIRHHLDAGVTFPPYLRPPGQQGRGEDASLRTDACLFMSCIKGSGSFSKWATWFWKHCVSRVEACPIHQIFIQNTGSVIEVESLFHFRKIGHANRLTSNITKLERDVILYLLNLWIYYQNNSRKKLDRWICHFFQLKAMTQRKENSNFYCFN